MMILGTLSYHGQECVIWYSPFENNLAISRIEKGLPRNVCRGRHVEKCSLGVVYNKYPSTGE